MARAFAGDVCLLCEEAPCACKSQRAKPRVTVRNKPDPVVIPTVTNPPVLRASFVEKMRQAARDAKSQEMYSVPPDHSRSKVQLSEEDAAFIQAVRLLNEVFDIHPDDLRPWRRYLDQPATAAERAAAWRFRRRYGG